MTTRIQVRRGTAAEWTSANPTLSSGEIGFETDTGKYKIGNGSTSWALRPYAAVRPQDLQNLTDPTITINVQQDGITSYNTAGYFQNSQWDAATSSTSASEATFASYTDGQPGGKVLTVEFPKTTLPPAMLSLIAANNNNGVISNTIYPSFGQWTLGSSGTTNSTITIYIDNLQAAAGGQFDKSDITKIVFMLDGGTAGTVVKPFAYSLQSLTKTISPTEISYLDNITSNVQTQLNSKLSLSGGTMTGALTLSGTPSSSNHAATKSYVDALAQGLDIKESVNYASVSNVTLSDLYDGNIKGGAGTTLPFGNGERILLKNQSNKEENGIWIISPDANTMPIRATDADSFTKLNKGSFVFVESGVNAGKGFVVTYTNEAGALGDPGTENSWSQFSDTGTPPQAGAGLSSVNGVLSIDSTVVTDSNTLTLTNKTINGTSNTLTVRLENDITGTLPILNGGTGATTQAGAANAILPSQASNSGKYLTTDGSNASWATVSSYSAPTLGSTQISSGATVTEISGLTLSNPILKTPDSTTGDLKYVAIKDNTVFTSTNGTTWTSGTTLSSSDWNTSVVYGNGVYVTTAGKFSGTEYRKVATSTDAVTWTVSANSALPANGNQWPYIHLEFAQGKFVAMSKDGYSAAYSTNGTAWTAGVVDTAPTSYPFDISGMAASTSEFVAVSRDLSESLRSTDGINWTVTTLPSAVRWNDIAYGDGKFVAVSYQTNVAISTNGITWTTATNSGSNSGAVTYGNGKFVAVGIYTANAYNSTNGVSWTTATLPASKFWDEIAYGGGKYIAFGSNDGKAISTNGVSWTTFTIANGWNTALGVRDDLVTISGNTVSTTEITYLDGATSNIQTQLNAKASLSGTETLTNKTLTSPVLNQPILISPEERANIVASAATGTINIDVLTSSVWYYTSNATANHTLNFRGSSGATLNSILSVGDSITVAWMNTNGTTPYYPNSIQIDGVSVTPRWQGGTAPSAGNASSTDVYTFTIIKTAATPTYLVLGSQTRFA